ncbi:MAG: hypothetical protein NZ528_07425 [Caldilineales bacterium]|nr:hypothetical protein [Caldilineales bacterium]
MSSVSSPATPSHGRAARRGANRLLIGLVAALVVTLLVGLLAIAAYLRLTRGRTDVWTWQDPLLAVDITRVRSDIGVIPLVGDSATASVQEALAAGEPDSAYALLVYDTRLSDGERMGQLLPVARAFEQVQAADLAALSYQQMHSLAALSPTLSDYERARGSLDAAAGFLGLGKPRAARPILAQAEVLARYSPTLAPVQRQEILQRLGPLYSEAGMAREAQEVAMALRGPLALPDSRLAPGPFLPAFQGQFTPPAEVQAAELNRRRAAVAYITAWDATGGRDVQAARAALAAALQAEDAARQAAFPASLQAAASLPDRAAVLQDRIHWLTLKLRVAAGALGFTLLPQWQVAVDGIAAELVQTYDQLWDNYDQQAAQLPDADQVNLARVEILRRALLLARLGLYPTPSQDNLALRLAEAQAAAADLLPLFVVEEPWGDGRIFRLSEALEGGP